ncbi:3-hydroxyacyl-CoA dehydrogenase family protein [Hymenobacter sp. BT770]|uniref:3-hydroxyacyl-CoA dehydrogenase family protein n=1 Tax=Hymenobacter sp. BT770 TaxID=2886942 RepID=UPI001D121841|nr:3-hydroxyacyl-CoA dehydrogenase family protein [Hymenobacter sp. BT770]MCC3153375.1 3-hydroxyacyl-CoA dehydrogenase [Hymenobacter sp. BT770]MDO3415543.1 3-hydroxyacyl-CoA dehydrogenase family protein [Hymenobacter sp. BT770]
MHILVLDGNHIETEFRAKFGPAHEYTFLENALAGSATSDENFQERGQAAMASANVVFNFSNSTSHFLLAKPTAVPLFQEATTSAMYSRHPQLSGFGFCGLPTLLNRPLLEIALSDKADATKLAEVCAALGTDYRVVEDRVGLVTPRVVCMIINEACYTVQEGTATMQDVDLGMKLGTNYPKGPFAWANAMGVERVYAVLEALWNDTHDERYKICPLLKRQALRGELFAI